MDREVCEIARQRNPLSTSPALDDLDHDVPQLCYRIREKLQEIRGHFEARWGNLQDYPQFALRATPHSKTRRCR